MAKLLNAVGILLFLSSTAVAENRNLTTDQIEKLLTGNTAVGRWIDHGHRQFLAADGSTIYAQESTRSSRYTSWMNY